MKEASVLRSATLSFSCRVFSLDDIPDDLDTDDLLEPEDFDLKSDDLEPLSVLVLFSLFLNQL